MNQAVGIKTFSHKYKTMDYWAKLSWKFIRFIILFGISFIIIYPLIIKISTCFMSYEDLTDPTVKLIPRDGSLVILKTAFNKLNYMSTMVNTLLLSGMVAIIQMIISSMAGYGLARFKFKGRNLLFLLIVVTLLVPPQTILVSEFVRFRYFRLFFWEFKLINTVWPFVLLSLTGLGLKNGLYIFLMRQFFRGMPYELEESAYIDGAGPIRTFLSIMLPNARNMMLTIFIFSFTWQWTDSNITPMFLPNSNVFSNTIAQTVTADMSEIAASAINNVVALLIIIPVLIVYIFAQRYIIQGVEQSGIVG